MFSSAHVVFMAPREVSTRPSIVSRLLLLCGKPEMHTNYSLSGAFCFGGSLLFKFHTCKLCNGLSRQANKLTSTHTFWTSKLTSGYFFPGMLPSFKNQISRRHLRWYLASEKPKGRMKFFLFFLGIDPKSTQTLIVLCELI